MGGNKFPARSARSAAVATSATVAASTPAAAVAARRAARSTVGTRPVVHGTARRFETARGLGKAGHAGGVDHHVPARSGAAAFAAHGGFMAQREVDHPPLAAVHRVEEHTSVHVRTMAQ